MPARLLALKRYQRTRRSRPFDDLPPDQRARAEGHYQRLCARWGDDLPPWRRAILAGRAKDLVVRPRDANWAYAMRRRQTRQRPSPAVTQLTRSQMPSPPATVVSQRAANSPQAIAVTPSVQPINLASCPAPGHTPSQLAELPVAPPPPAAVRLDLDGVTISGADGHDTAQRILRDLDHALGRTVRFSVSVPDKDLPARWAWRLELVPVP
jgi:hypothetical protein